MKSVFSFFLLIGLTGLLGCNTGKSNTETEKTSDEFEAKEENLAEMPFIETDTVIIQNMEFQPHNVLVHKGRKLVWLNKGIVGHNVTENPDRTWTSGDFEVGETWEMTPTESFDYLCTIHPTMTGSVKVVD